MFILIASLFISCEENQENQLADFELELSNKKDEFAIQVSDMINVSEIVEYTWCNSKNKASVDQSTVTKNGSANVLIFDASSNQVYSRDLNEDGNFDTDTGDSGNWKIRIELSGADGTMNFRVQKKE